MKRISDSTKVTLTLNQIKRLVKEASKFDPELVADGNKLVNEAIKQLEKTTDGIEKVTEYRDLLKKFTSQAIEKARQAKAAKSAADAMVKTDAKPLDDAAKRLADLLQTNEDVFFSARENGHKVGIILTTVKKVISQDDSNAAILERLQDPEFIRKNEKLRGLSERMLTILEEARDQLREIGFFDKGEEELTRKAQGLYSLDDDEFIPLKEGFVERLGGKIMAMLRKAGEWIRGFLPSYARQETRYVSELEEWNNYLEDLEQQIRPAVAESRKRARRACR